MSCNPNPMNEISNVNWWDMVRCGSGNNSWAGGDAKFKYGAAAEKVANTCTLKKTKSDCENTYLSIGEVGVNRHKHYLQACKWSN